MEKSDTLVQGDTIELDVELDALARTLQIDGRIENLAQTIAQNPRSTIEPQQMRSDAPGRLAIAGLGEQRDERGIAAGLAYEKTLGEGGMGIVRLATQRALGRKVAVKTLRESVKDDHATLRLLREAWVTGSLEHPNIVPVYDLGLDEDGRPIIVLKNIQGAPWDAVLRDPDAARALAGATDPFEQHLRTLVQLCHAVGLAHARGILHRDLKPENVMLGRFGDVYLVDWGIAVSLEKDPSGRLPHVDDAREIAGTPCYMAPEMLGAIGTLSVRTDVYLLGAILHEILTGSPPHQGTFKQIMGSILVSRFTYGPDVPPELAAIARKAMSREPDDRFASADELRERLEWFLRHRGSLALSTVAQKSLVAMRGAIAEGGAERDRIYHLFAEARFGFRQALSACEDNEPARVGLRETITDVVTFELAHGTPEAAHAALAELDAPPPELAKRVADRLAERAGEREKVEHLQRLEAEHDPTTGRRTRFAVAAVSGLVWTLGPQLGPVFEARSPHLSIRFMYVWTGILVALSGLLGFWGRETLSKTALNRMIRASPLVVFAAQGALEVSCELLKIPFDSAIALHFVVWFSMSAAIATYVDPFYFVPAAGYLVAGVVVAVAPAWKWHVMSIAHGVFLFSALHAARIEKADGALFRQRFEEHLERHRGPRRWKP